MFKISHESPMCLLEESKIYNDYDYALVHLFETRPDYLSFFKKQIRAGRTVILDNSAYELGQPFNIERYVHFIELLRPTEYVLPDYRDDAYGTLLAADKWNKQFKNLVVKDDYNPTTIGVVHGESYSAYVDCYLALLPRVDKIAFSFESFFKDFEPGLPIEEQRKAVLGAMLENEVIDKSRRHHILGALSPFEYLDYVGYEWIESVDTSSPVIHGILGDDLKHLSSVDYVKPSLKLEEAIDISASKGSLKGDLILSNIKYFREALETRENYITRQSEVSPVSTEDLFKKVTSSLADLLTYKNAQYGNAALDPVNIFTGRCKVGQRLDDKLSRIKNSDELRKNDVADLMGYLTLVCVENDWTDFSEFKD